MGLYLELRPSCLWNKKQVWPHYFLVFVTVSQLPVSTTPMSTHTIQIKQIELFQIYITITWRRRWPCNNFYRLHWNVDFSCLQESDVFMAKEQEQWGTKGTYEKPCFKYALLRFSYLFLFFKSSASGNCIELIFSRYSSSGPAEKWWTVQVSPWRIPWNSPGYETHRQKTHMHDVNFNDHQEDSTRSSKASKCKFVR